MKNVDTENIIADCREMLLAVAPELRAQPLYVVAVSEFDGLPVPPGCLGWAHSRAVTEWPFVDRLADRWEGVGPIIAMDLDAIEREAEPGQFERCVRNVAIHEAAHILPPIATVDVARTDALAAHQLNQLRRGTELHNACADAFDAPDDAAHDHRFIRRACHLFTRAVALGYDVPPYRLFGPRVWVSWTEGYVVSLLAELFSMRDARISEIEATEPPAQFTEMWARNVEFYHSDYYAKRFFRS